MADTRNSLSRRDALKLTGLVGASVVLGQVPSRAAPKSLTLMHESCFIGAYDAYFKNDLAPAYEKATGIKVNYELISVGSLQCQAFERCTLAQAVLPRAGPLPNVACRPG